MATARVFRIAVASRLLVVALIALFRSVASPYDTSAAINPSCLSSDAIAASSSSSRSVIFPGIGSLIERSVVWDGVYFLRIAQCGYEYEQTYAFLPLFPICIRLLSHTMFAPLVGVIGYRAVLALSGYVISNVAFVFAAVFLYRVSLLVLKDNSSAYLASLLFCFNPASIFYSSVYSESLYSFFSLGGIYYLLAGSNCLSAQFLAISGFARSNGVLNAGYFCFRALHDLHFVIFQKRSIQLAVWIFFVAAARIFTIFVPFIAYQLYGYYKICLGSTADDPRPWCKARVPFLYDFIQSHYWGVGFLRYFQLKQLPNFLLASPILSLSICSVVHYMKTRPEVVFTLGFGASQAEKVAASIFYSGYRSKIFQTVSPSKKHDSIGNAQDGIFRREHFQRKQKNRGNTTETSRNCSTVVDEARTFPNHEYSSILIVPFILQLAFMSFVAFFVMHVQVATRFLSASPPIYWFSAYLIRSSRFNWSRLICVYFLCYLLIGSLLFSNFYPFT